MKEKLTAVSVLVAVTLSPSFPTAWATDPASSGATSSGTSTDTLIIPPLVKITGIADLTLSPNYAGGGGLTQYDDVCVFSNMDTAEGEGHKYSVDMSGNGTGTTFKLTCQAPTDCYDAAQPGGNADQISYLPYWNDQAGTNSGETAAGTRGGASTQITGQTGWSNSPTCGGGTNARFRVDLQETDILNNKRAGTYQGTLTITITPAP